MAKAKRERPSICLQFIYPRKPPELLKVYWHRWEFLRRNPEYGTDYAKFMSRFGLWFRKRGLWFEVGKRMGRVDTRRGGIFLCQNLPSHRPAMLEMADWKSLFSNLEVQSKNCKREYRGETVFLPTAVAPELNWDLRYMRMLIEYGFIGTGDSARRLSNHLLVEFDLKWPLKDLVQYANRALKRAKENYEWELEERNDLPRNTRRRFDDYNLHLNIWDLSQKGRSVAEIARQLFPKEVIDSAQQKVRDHLKTAKRLVSSGYQEIR